MWIITAYRQSHNPSWLAWSESWRPPVAECACFAILLWHTTQRSRVLLAARSYGQCHVQQAWTARSHHHRQCRRVSVLHHQQLLRQHRHDACHLRHHGRFASILPTSLLARKSSRSGECLSGQQWRNLGFSAAEAIKCCSSLRKSSSGSDTNSLIFG